MSMVSIDTRQAQGDVLNWLVAKCEGYEPVYTDPAKAAGPLFIKAGPTLKRAADYAGRPEFAAMILDREEISTVKQIERFLLSRPTEYPMRWGVRPATQWDAYWGSVRIEKGSLIADYRGTGSTSFEAGLRCYVLGRLGQQVEVPSCLLSQAQGVVESTPCERPRA